MKVIQKLDKGNYLKPEQVRHLLKKYGELYGKN